MTYSKRLWAYTLLLSLNAIPAQAMLIDRGNGMIYDSAQNITWLQDANYARTSGYDSDGLMNWNDATVWAAGLVYQSYDDWRLPTITDTHSPGCDWAYSGTDCGYNSDTASSEMAYMYFVNLGLKSYRDASDNYQSDFGIFGNGTFNGVDWSSYGQNNVGLVNNLQSYAYWSGSEYAPFPISSWAFDTSFGGQHLIVKYGDFFAWAVRSGDVALPAQRNNVPEPGSLALLSLGLIALRRAKRR